MKQINKIRIVTPHVGVWIETPKKYSTSGFYLVTPHVGVWIETLEVSAKNVKI